MGSNVPITQSEMFALGCYTRSAAGIDENDPSFIRSGAREEMVASAISLAFSHSRTGPGAKQKVGAWYWVNDPHGVRTFSILVTASGAGALVDKINQMLASPRRSAVRGWTKGDRHEEFCNSRPSVLFGDSRHVIENGLIPHMIGATGHFVFDAPQDFSEAMLLPKPQPAQALL